MDLIPIMMILIITDLGQDRSRSTNELHACNIRQQPLMVTGSTSWASLHSVVVPRSLAPSLAEHDCKTLITMSIHASNGTCELLAWMALGPVNQLSLWLLPTACHLESPGPIAEVRLGRSLNLLPGRQWDEAHLQQHTCSSGFARNLLRPHACCTFKAHGQSSVTGHLAASPAYSSM